jgi:hypothetical protein
LINKNIENDLEGRVDENKWIKKTFRYN